MKHRILFPLFCLALMTGMASCGDSIDIPTPTEIPQGDGKLKAVWAGYDNARPNRLAQLYEYDTQERISKVSTFIGIEATNTPLGYDSYEYNEDGLLSTIKSYTSEDRGWYIITNTEEYAYGENGQLIQKTIRYPGSDYYPQTTRYAYDKDGKLTEQTEYDKNDALIFKTLFLHNELGQITLEKRYTAKGMFHRMTEHIYEKGLNVQTTIYSDERKALIMHQVVRTYDERNNLIKEVTTRDMLSSYSGTRYLLYEYF